MLSVQTTDRVLRGYLLHSILKAGRTKLAGYGEGDDALNEGIVKCSKNDLTYLKGVELPKAVLPLVTLGGSPPCWWKISANCQKW